MTCLTTNDIVDIPVMWEDYDRRMSFMLGTDLISLASAASGRSADLVRKSLNGRKLAVVPVSVGSGIIPGFVESVASIGLRLGMNAAVMNYSDGDGFKQAEDLGADFVISADDHRYIAREMQYGRLADNNLATSSVFVTALELMCGGDLAEKEVVVLGMGVIGRMAAVYLLEKGAYPLLYDPNHKRSLAAMKELDGGEMLINQKELRRALGATNIIFDATPVQEALLADDWPVYPIVAAPGMPLSWPAEWMQPGATGGRLWHDPLQSGTAAMLARLA